MRKHPVDAIGVTTSVATPRGRLARVLRRLRGARSGNAAVEFALLAPFLLGLMVPLADVGAYVYDYMQIQLAAQAGAEYAARHGWDPTGIQNAVIAAAPSLNLQLVDNNFTAPANSDVLPAPFTASTVQFCGCASGTTITQTPAAPATCPNPRPACPGTNPVITAGVYYTIGAQTFYHTISGFKYPFLANNQVIKAWTIVRVQ
jgi:Flp pilus assembly protein TadG